MQFRQSCHCHNHIKFFAIENDTHRKGFLSSLLRLRSLLIRCSANNFTSIDRKTLILYVSRNVGDVGTPRYYRSLASSSDGAGAVKVAKILRGTIRSAGLSDEYTARGFMAAGATAAIRSGCDTDPTRQIGRWASREVFYDHLPRSSFSNRKDHCTDLDLDVTSCCVLGIDCIWPIVKDCILLFVRLFVRVHKFANLLFYSLDSPSFL